MGFIHLWGYELIFILFAALCSVAVSVVLKRLTMAGFNSLAMVVWNYASASILCFLWFKPALFSIHFEQVPWWLIVILGIVLPSIFLALSRALTYAGIVKTEIAQRLSAILSIIAAYFIFHEQFSTSKIFGVVLGLVAVSLLILSRGNIENKVIHKKAVFSLLSVWVGYALVDILLKYNSSLGQGFAQSLNLIFITAFIFSLVYGLIKQKSILWKRKNICAGLFLGVLNFANIALYVNAHIALKSSPAIVFAAMNIFVVIFGILSGVILFKEKMNLKMLCSLVLALGAVLCLMNAM